MHKFPSQKEIINSVIKGIETAKNNFTYWTADELFLSYAPAKFLTIHISQEIAKLENAPEIFIDAPVADILRCSLPSRRDFRDFMKTKYLAQDIMCLTLDERFEHKSDNDSISRVIMSIKNGVRNVKEEYKNEIEKMCKMIDREKLSDSTLDYGLFAFYLDISNSARKKSEQRIEEIIDNFDKIVSSYSNLKSRFEGGNVKVIPNIGEYSIGCYIIEPNFK
ncbi:hypothetical protein CPU12_09380 [Malaciobacter molluscorum LMG 25693]|uniref:Uncharacterized protein n=1 Tax=Malaciobacter molluscorum LMG 25693 TaxID=870501 RepID=A0A2G1DGM4_9BACT|nr:hypothetical protein [Malaciobacter molluscorum]AXX92489.1 hypothetical protein AMOL_1519 [Malaciobacter molluscorum LMG 25693]PHO17641.1 hypothetical protein CPU12_09380 [Malaciobacter molluscorum LMG 25693]